MTITANQQECKARVLAREPLWTPEPPLSNGATDHGENRGWVAEALQGTPYAVQIGSEWVINRHHPHGDQLWEELISTQWGRDIRNQLWAADGSPLPAGWKRGGFGAARKTWWEDNKHEINATNKLIGNARNPPGVSASIAAVPGSGEQDSIWDVSPYSGPDDEPAWLVDCKRDVLFPDQYAELRRLLKLPPDEVVDPPGTCVVSELQHCLCGGRFAVKVSWTASDGSSGSGRVAEPRTDVAGLFYFAFDPNNLQPDNWEMLIKVLDARDINGYFWVFAACATDLGFEISVVDTVTGERKVYTNEPGTPAVAINDTSAFEG